MIDRLMLEQLNDYPTGCQKEVCLVKRYYVDGSDKNLKTHIDVNESDIDSLGPNGGKRRSPQKR